MTDDSALRHRLGGLLDDLRDRIADGVDPGEARRVGLAVGGAAVVGGLVALALRSGGDAGEEPRRDAPGGGSDDGPRWIRAVGAGLGATAAELVVRALLVSRAEDRHPVDILEELVEGAGDGIVYASLVKAGPPVPAAVAGAAYGLADYLARPWGGASGAVLTALPKRHFPVAARALTGKGRRGSGDLYEHLVFGIVLATIYGS